MTTQQKKFFDSISVKTAFLLGAFSAMALFSFIGLVSLAYIMVVNVDNEENTDTGTIVENTTDDADNIEPEYTTSIDLASIRYTKGSGNFTFIEYTDLECPFCKTFHETINEITADYDGKIAFATKHLPLNIHSKAEREAGAAECAGKQGKFFEYVDKIFEVTPSNNKLEDERLFTIADELGLDSSKFTDCVENEDYKEDVTADALEAISTGGQGTPHSILLDKEGGIITRFKGALPASQLKEAFAELTAE